MKEINLAQNITLLRKKNNVTQEQLAQALNISPQAVSKWETNTSQPDTQTLPQIAEYFHVSIDYLFYGDNFSYSDIYSNFPRPKSVENLYFSGFGRKNICLLTTKST